MKRAKALLTKTATATQSTPDVPTTAEVHPVPPMSEEVPDPLDTPFVETDPLLLPLDPFEGAEQPIAHPTTAETIRVESNVEMPLESTKKTSKQLVAKKTPKQSTKGKAPWKQTTPKRKTPGTGLVWYVPKAKDIKAAREAGHLYPDDPAKKRTDSGQAISP